MRSILLLGAAILLGQAASAQAPLGCPESLERQLLELTNQARATGLVCNGVFYPPAPPLELDVRLMEAAQLHSDDMASGDFVSHTGSGGAGPGHRITLAGYSWWGWGENIAAGQSSAAQAVDSWLASTTGHCEALMDPDYAHLGVGHASNPQATYVHYWTQSFAIPAPSETRVGPESECPQCSDALDNDGDGDVDHPSDAQCTSGSDDRESPNPAASCGLGAELVPLLGLLGWASRRRHAHPASSR